MEQEHSIDAVALVGAVSDVVVKVVAVMAVAPPNQTACSAFLRPVRRTMGLAVDKRNTGNIVQVGHWKWAARAPWYHLLVVK